MQTREVQWGELKGVRKFEHAFELPEDYRSFLIKLIWVQADTEFASVQQHRPWLDRAPSFEDRWIEARIIADEMRHGWQMVKILDDFGQDGLDFLDVHGTGFFVPPAFDSERDRCLAAGGTAVAKHVQSPGIPLFDHALGSLAIPVIGGVIGNAV